MARALKKFSEIPGPKPLPLIGNLWRYLPVIGEYDHFKMPENYQKMHALYGPLVREKIIGKRELLHVFDPQDMEWIYRNEGAYPSRTSHCALLKFRLSRHSKCGGGGLIPTNGDDWKRYRTLFQTILLHPQAVSKHLEPLVEVTEDLVLRIAEQNGEVKDWQNDLYLWSLECVGKLALNARLGCFDKNAEEAMKIVHATSVTHEMVMLTENGSPLWRYFPTKAYRTLEKCQSYVEDRVWELMQPALKKSQDRDSNQDQEQMNLLEQMLRVPDAKFSEVLTMVMDLFMAGIDTTAYTSSYLLYCLAVHPECQKQARGEIRAHLGPNRTITSETMKNALYLRMCFKETTRIYPISLGVGRVLTEDIALRGYFIPAQTMVINQHMVASLLEQNFTDPNDFKPLRWKREAGKRLPNHPFVSLPFGFGRRMCIGRYMAELEVQLLVATILRDYSFEYVGEKPLGCKTKLINVPDKPLLLKFTKIDP